MKKICLILSLLVSFYSFSQEEEDEKIKSLKTAYITKTLELTTQEAEKFWPVYNEYENKKDNLYEDKWCDVKNGLNTIKLLDNGTADALLAEYIELKEESLVLKKEFFEQLKSIISSKKILMLKKAEHDFHKILLEKYRNK